MNVSSSKLQDGELSPFFREPARPTHNSRQISDLSKLAANSSSYFPARHATIMVRLILTGYCNTQCLRLTQRDLPAEALKVSALHHRKRNSATSWKQEQ